MENEKMYIPVNWDVNWYGITSLDRILKDVEEMKSLGITHLEISAEMEQDYYDKYPEPQFDCLSYREKTEEELKQEKESYDNYINVIKKRELDTLKELKEKYEKE